MIVGLSPGACVRSHVRSVWLHMCRCLWITQWVSSSCFGAEESSQSQVSQFHHSCGCDEYVGWFDIWQKRREEEGWRKRDTKITIWGAEIPSSGSWSLTVKTLIEGNTNQRVWLAFSLWFSCLWNVMPQCNYKWILNRHPVKWPLKLRGH